MIWQGEHEAMLLGCEESSQPPPFHRKKEWSGRQQELWVPAFPETQVTPSRGKRVTIHLRAGSLS